MPIPNNIVDDPNSDAAFAERMRYRLMSLLENPAPFLPSYKERYGAMLSYAASLSPQQAYAMTMLMGEDSSFLYPDMPNTAELRFPDVNAWQPTAQCGWYYFSGHCTASNGTTYGVMFMMFGNSLLPPPVASAFGLTDVQNQIIDMQLAVTVQDGDFYQADPIVTAGTSGEVKISDALYIEARSCSVRSTQQGQLFPLNIKAKGWDRSGEKPTLLEIDFTFTSGQSYLPQGLDGAVPLVAGVGTRYYSIPQLVLDAANSKLTVGDEAIELAAGRFWMDHQWGLGMTPSGSPRFPVMQAVANLKQAVPTGWDFFALNLDSGGAITLNSIHGADSLKFINQTGELPPTSMVAPVVGTYMDPFGTAFHVSGTMEVHDWRKTDSTPNPAKYKNIGTWVPHGAVFTLVEGVVPPRYRNFRLQHINEKAQCLWYSQGSRYVEAAVVLQGEGDQKLGVGYQEAVGYIDALPAALSLAGMPTDPATLALFDGEPVTRELFWKSLAFAIENYDQFEQLINAGSFPPAPRTSGDTPPSSVDRAPLSQILSQAQRVIRKSL